MVEGIDLALESLVRGDARWRAEAIHVGSGVFPVGEVHTRLWAHIDGEEADLVKVGVVVVEFVDRSLWLVAGDQAKELATLVLVGHELSAGG